MPAVSAKNCRETLYSLVEGDVRADEGTISGNIGRHAELKFWSLKEDGKPSETRYRVRERFDGRTLLELQPVTGRTNQLRIHCASIGHPIVEDIERGGPRHSRLCLHAYRLAFKLPSSGQFTVFERGV